LGETLEADWQGRVERFIEDRKFEEARQALDYVLRNDQNNAAAWALAGYLGRSKLEQELALRKVFDLTENLELSTWALRELAVVTRSGQQEITRPPLTLIEVGKLKPTRRKPSLSLRLIRIGLVGFFVGLIGVYGIFALQERGLDMVNQGARNLIPLLRLSVFCFYGTAAGAAIGVLAVVAGIVISFFPRRD